MARKERRHNRRVDVPVSITYHVDGRDLKDTWYPGVLANLAAGGLRFTCDRILGEGDSLGFRVTLPTRSAPYYIGGVIIWAMPMVGGVDCGVAFRDLSPDEQFELDELAEFLNARTFRPQRAEDAG